MSDQGMKCVEKELRLKEAFPRSPREGRLLVARDPRMGPTGQDR